MTDPVSNIQIEDVLASIRKLVSEEVRAQTRAEEQRQQARAPQPPAEEEPSVEKLVLSPNLRVADEEVDDGLDKDLFGEPEVDLSVLLEDEPGDQLYDAPFEEEAETSFAEEAEVYDFQSRAPVEEAPADVAEEVGLDADDLSIDAVIAALSGEFADEAEEEAPSAEQPETDWTTAEAADTPENFGDWGDGAAEALASAQFATEAESHPVEEPVDDAAEDARFDDLDAVLSTLDFDPAPEPQTERYLTEVEDAELVEETSAVDTFERLFRQDAGRTEAAVETAVADPDDTPEAELDTFVEAGQELEPEEIEEVEVAVEVAHELADDVEDFTDETEVAEAKEWEDTPSDQALAQASGYIPEGSAEAQGGASLDEAMLRDLVSEIIRQELQGALGERITRNVRKLVRREIQRALQSQDYI